MVPQTIALYGALTRPHIAKQRLVLTQQINNTSDVVLDLSEVSDIDSTGVAMLIRIHKKLSQHGFALRIESLQSHIAHVLALFPYPQNHESEHPEPISLWLRIGNTALLLYNICVHFLALFADLIWFGGSSVKSRQFRSQNYLYEMMTMGPNALVVVGLIAFLVGTTIAIQSAAQLRQLGANILIVDLIGVSITRELGPLITAIVTTGRTGSAIAAEIATMVITEEIDALIALGIQPLRFIVLPKILALMTILPILSIYANVMAILGGVWVAQWLLDVPVTTFINRLQVVVLTDDIISGLFKSLLFAILIGTVSAFCGLRTQGGADAVGFSTTKSVVVGLFSIIIGDAICSFLFHGMK